MGKQNLTKQNKKALQGGLTVIAASMHGLLRPTYNHNYTLLNAGRVEIKPRILVISTFHER